MRLLEFQRGADLIGNVRSWESTAFLRVQRYCLVGLGLRRRLTRDTGGNDVFVDIGDKSWGVLAAQRFFGGIEGGKTLHVGDQFLSAGANDFKARLACTTAWIANPGETVQLLDEIAELDEMQQRKTR